MASTKAKSSQKETIIEIPKPEYRIIKVTISGETPVNVHRLGKKMAEEFEARDHGKPLPKKKIRDYDLEFIDSLYYIDPKTLHEVPAPKKITKACHYGFPASSFKKAMVAAARQFSNLKMTELRGRFYVNQFTPYVEIKGVPQMEKFWRRIGGKGPGTGTPDRGVRAVFFPWEAELQIRFLKNLITPESILNLLNVAGFSVGIGEDRPDKSGGTGGMWTVVNSSMA